MIESIRRISRELLLTMQRTNNYNVNSLWENEDLEREKMKIVEIKNNKKKYISLLLLADEQEDMIARYLERGTMFVLEEQGVKAECVVTDEGNGVLEIKNLATEPAYQGRGYGKALIDYVAENFKDKYSLLLVGTGDSPLTIPFYEKCGFQRSHIVKDFFVDHYDHPIYEAGVQLIDMIYLQRKL